MGGNFLILLLCAATGRVSAGDLDERLDVGQVPSLVQALRYSESHESASQTLTKIGPPALPFLLRAVQGGDPSTRLAALNVIGRMGPAAKDAVPDLIAALGQPDLLLRYSAASALAKIGPDAKAAVPTLLANLRVTDEALRVQKVPVATWDNYLRSVYGALAGIGEPALPPLIEALRGSDPTYRARAAEALVPFGAEARDAVPALVEILQQPAAEGKRDSTRSFAMTALAGMGSVAEPAVPALSRLLTSGSASEKIEAASALGALRDVAVDAIPALVGVLKNERNLQVRDEARKALLRIGRPAADELIGLLDGDKRDVQYLAADTLVSMGKPAVPFLIDALKSRNAELRLKASDALAKIGLPAVEMLLETTGYDDPSVRFTTAQTLAQIGPAAKEAVPGLLEGLRSTDLGVRVAAAADLGAIGEDAADAVPGLILALQISPADQTAANVQQQVWQAYFQSIASALSDIGESAVDSLVKALRDPEAHVRTWASQALIQIDRADKLVVPALIDTLNEPDEGQHQQAYWALKQIAPGPATLARLDERAIPILIAALKDPDETFRSTAVQALVRIGKPAIVPLVGELSGHDLGVRILAADALGDMGSSARDAVPALIDALRINDEIPQAKDITKDVWRTYLSQVSEALGSIGQPAVPALIGATKDYDEIVRFSALRALAAVGRNAEPAIPALIEGLDEENLSGRILAVQALAKIGPAAAEAVPNLIECLRIKDEAIRRPQVPKQVWRGYLHEVAKSIAAIGNPAVPALVDSLEDNDEILRKHVAWALIQIAPEPRALDSLGDTRVPVLIKGMQDDDWMVRFASVRTLWGIGPQAKDAIPALIEGLYAKQGDFQGDDVPPEAWQAYVRWCSEALATIGEPAAPALVDKLREENQTVRLLAAWSLRRMGLKAESLASLGADALPTLIDALRSPSSSWGKSAQGALVKLDYQAVPALLEALRKEETREGAADVLLEIGDAAARGLVAALEDENPEVRVEAARALGGEGPAAKDYIPPPYVAPALLKALEDENENVRRYAAQSLKWLDPAAAEKAGIE